VAERRRIESCAAVSCIDFFRFVVRSGHRRDRGLEPVDRRRGRGIIEVPSEVATVQEAVDAAEPGDLVLIAPGVYNEAVDVTTDDVTIRGLDRDEVVFDGEFELANGIRVLGASGVAIENLTLGNYSPDVLDPAANDDLRTMRLGANRTVRSCSLRAVARSAGRTRRHDR